MSFVCVAWSSVHSVGVFLAGKVIHRHLDKVRKAGRSRTPKQEKQSPFSYHGRDATRSSRVVPPRFVEKEWAEIERLEQLP